MRLQYYEDKRRVFSKQVEETIRSGIIDDVKNEFPPVVKQPTAMNRTAGSQGRQQQIFGTTTSPRTVLSKHAMNFVHDYGLDMPSSTMPPEIMLRDPLDQEFVLNRKMAKKYYETQLQQRMAENRMKNQEQLEKKKKDVMDLDAKKEKALADQRKHENAALNSKVRQREEEDAERKRQRRMQARETATKILKDARAEHELREELERAKKEEYDRKLEEDFKRDKERRQLIAQKGDEAAMQKREEEKHIVEKITKAEANYMNVMQSKEMQLKMKMDRAVQKAEQRNEQTQKKREEEKKAEDERVNAYMNKIQKVKTTRVETEKKIKAMVARPDKLTPQERLAGIKKMKQQEAREQAAKIRAGMQQREAQVQRNLSYLKEENERRKEVKNLHKIDQEDNLQRKQAFEKMGLENRVQMILEKASRVQKPAF